MAAGPRLLTLVKGLPMAYNRDLQEDKEPLFDTVDQIKLALEDVAAFQALGQRHSRRLACRGDG